VLDSALGKDRVYPKPPVMGGEDFSQFGRAGVPICMIRLGTVDPSRYREFEAGRLSLPSLHSDLFAPVPEPTIKTGVHAMAAAVLDLLCR
jgi:hippurate hydrolase